MPGPSDENHSETPHAGEHRPSPDGRHGPPAKDPGGRFIINDERRRDVEQIGGFLESIGSELRTRASIELNGQTIRPASTPVFVARYERLPRGERKLLFEIEWEPRQTDDSRDVVSDFVREKTSAPIDRSDESGEGGDDETPNESG